MVKTLYSILHRSLDLTTKMISIKPKTPSTQPLFFFFKISGIDAIVNAIRDNNIGKSLLSESITI